MICCLIWLLSCEGTISNSSENKHPMPSNSSKIVVTSGFYSFCKDGRDNNNFVAFSLSASDDLQNL